jgi:hypothetical protein
VKHLTAEIDARPVPETFWGDFSRVVNNVSAHGQYGAIRPQVDNLLRVYIARNGNYLSQSLIEAAYHANGDSVDWLISVTNSASDQEGLLESLVNSSWPSGTGWIRSDQIGTLLARVVELEEKNAAEHPDQNQWSLDEARRRLVTALVEKKQFAQARDLLARVPAQMRLSGDWLPAVLAVEARRRPSATYKPRRRISTTPASAARCALCTNARSRRATFQRRISWAWRPSNSMRAMRTALWNCCNA